MIGAVLRDRLMEFAFSRQVSVSLHSAEPGRDGNFEIRVDRQPAQFIRVSAGTWTNQNAVQFANMPKSEVTHWGVWDGSDFWWGAVADEAKEYKEGDAAWVAPGTLVLVLS